MPCVLAGGPGPQTSPATAVVVMVVLVILAGGAFGVAALVASGACLPTRQTAAIRAAAAR